MNYLPLVSGHAAIYKTGLDSIAFELNAISVKNFRKKIKERTKVIVTFMHLQNVPRLVQIYLWSHGSCLFTKAYFFCNEILGFSSMATTFLYTIRFSTGEWQEILLCFRISQ